MNKSDLSSEHSIHLRNESQINVSLKTGDGLDVFKTRLSELVVERSTLAQYAIVVRERHLSAVQKTIRKLNDILERKNLSIEVMAEELRDACRILSSITGRVDVEDLLAKIFSEFCIGK